VLTAAVVLSGCSDIYYDRRETILLGANDAVETNKVTQMIDPWPPYSANRNIAFNGERIGGAIERYRHHEVIKPPAVGTSTLANQQVPTLTEALPTSQSTTSVSGNASSVSGATSTTVSPPAKQQP
jgi:hypothetical protein